MALQKPILNTIPAFDATQECRVGFVVNSGDQVVRNRAIVRLGSTNEIVYDMIQTTFDLIHTIPAYTLTNGNYYTIQIQTYNQAGSASPLSSPITFYCYSQPEFRITNIPSDNILTNTSFNFQLGYNQTQGEALSSWIINVYDSSRTILWSSGTNYAGANGIPPTNFNFEVSGFNDASIYFVRAMGQTEQQTILDTGYILLKIVYASPSIYTLFSLTNNECEGYIMITSNVISLDGTTNPDTPIYIDNKELDLLGDESYVNWENSFAIYDTSTARIWLRNMKPNSIIATFYNSNNPSETLNLFQREITENNVNYMIIEGYYLGEDGTNGYIYSNKIAKPNSADYEYYQYMIWLQKRNGMYDLSLDFVKDSRLSPQSEE